MNEDRIDELVQAYLHGEAGLEQLQELKGLLDAGDETSRRVASMLADGGMIAGWFRAEADERFVDEAMAASGTKKDDPEFVGKTLEKIEQASVKAGSRRRFARIAGGRETFSLVPALAAAGILVAVAALLVIVLPRRNGKAGPVESAQAPPVETRDTAPAPDRGELDRQEMIKELERLREERRRQEEDLVRIETEKKDLIRQQKTEEAEAKARAEEDRKRQLERLAEEERLARERLEKREAPAATTTRERKPLLLAATVERAQGEAFVAAEDGKSAAKAGLPVYRGQGVETAGPKSLVVVKFADGTRMDLGGDTVVRNLREREGGKGKSVFVARGTVTADVVRQPPGLPMAFVTAHAEATVLGTKLRISIEGNSTRLDVREGRVILARLPGGAAVEVPAGFYGVAGPGQEPELRHEQSVTLSFQDDVSPMPRYSGTRDCHFGEHKQDAEQNFGIGGQVWVDGDCRPPQGDDRYALIKWDLSAIPPGSTVLSASIGIQVVNNSAGNPFHLYEMKREWVENQATWMQAAAKRPWQVPGARGPQDRGNVVLGGLGPRVNGPYTAALNPAGVAVVQSWVDNPPSNHGFWLGKPDNGDALGFESHEAAQPANRPKLTVVFVPKGREVRK